MSEEFTEIIVPTTVEQHLAEEHVRDLGRHVPPDCETFISATLTGYLLPEENGDRKAGT